MLRLFIAGTQDHAQHRAEPAVHLLLSQLMPITAGQTGVPYLFHCWMLAQALSQPLRVVHRTLHAKRQGSQTA